MRASTMGLNLDTRKCGAGLGEGPVWKQVRGGKRDPQKRGLLTQEDFTSCGCGGVGPSDGQGKGPEPGLALCVCGLWSYTEPGTWNALMSPSDV